MLVSKLLFCSGDISGLTRGEYVGCIQGGKEVARTKRDEWTDVMGANERSGHVE